MFHSNKNINEFFTRTLVSAKFASWRERESYIKYNSLALVKENIDRVNILGVVIGKSGRDLGVSHITLRNHNAPG